MSTELTLADARYTTSPKPRLDVARRTNSCKRGDETAYLGRGSYGINSENGPRTGKRGASIKEINLDVNSVTGRDAASSELSSIVPNGGPYEGQQQDSVKYVDVKTNGGPYQTHQRTNLEVEVDDVTTNGGPYQAHGGPYQTNGGPYQAHGGPYQGQSNSGLYPFEILVPLSHLTYPRYLYS